MKTMTLDEFKPQRLFTLLNILLMVILPTRKDDEEYNHDELQGLIENFCDDNNFDPWDNDKLSYTSRRN